jgi:hypothetical protein
MQLTMREHGCLSKQYQPLKDQGIINRNRLSPELIRWTDTSPTDGLGAQDPQTYRYVADIPNGQFTTQHLVDERRIVPTKGMTGDMRE